MPIVKRRHGRTEAFVSGLGTTFCAGLVAMLFVASATAQTSPPIPSPIAIQNPLGIQPLTQPLRLGPLYAPSLRFAAEFRNDGVPLPGSPLRMLIEGVGSVASGAKMTAWTLHIERIVLDGLPMAGAPLVALTVAIDPAALDDRVYRTNYAGFFALPQGAPQSPIRNVVFSFVDTLAYAFPAAPSQPVGERSPIIDLGPALRHHLAKALPGAQMQRPPAPGLVAGQVSYNGRTGVLVNQTDHMIVNTSFRSITLNIEGTGVIDAQTAIPLFARARMIGPVDLPILRGTIDYTVTMAASVDQMGDPLAVLASINAPPPPPPAPRQPEASPRPASPVAAPAPKPQAPAAKPPAAPATQDETVKRLEVLKNLYDRGLITKEQYEARQKEILGAL